MIHREAKTFAHRAAAVTWARHREVQLEDPTALIQAQDGTQTLARVIRWYIDTFQSVSKWQRTKQTHLEFLERHQIGKSNPFALTTAILVDHVRSRRAEGTGAATVANDLTWLGVVHGPVLPSPDVFPYAGVVEVNEQCVDLLVYQARTDAFPPFQLVTALREPLRQTTPEMRKRAAARPYLLLELEFQNPEWWEAVRRYPNKKLHTSGGGGSLPRGSGLSLARATLLLAWQGCRAHLDTACILFGITRRAAEVIAGFQLTEIDRIADRRFRHLRPRWQDRPDFWRSLFSASEASTPAALRHLDLYALALVDGELMPVGGEPAGT